MTRHLGKLSIIRSSFESPRNDHFIAVNIIQPHWVYTFKITLRNTSIWYIIAVASLFPSSRYGQKECVREVQGPQKMYLDTFRYIKDDISVKLDNKV